ncbi:MAG: hypothetical protein KC493_07225 [Bacteriovoracaceae bacterium]|nr:hypothetical protein [Bacteriovoracaceae bacterium]
MKFEVKRVINTSSFDKIFKDEKFSLQDLTSRVESFIPKSSFPYLSEDNFRLIENWRSVSIAIGNGYHLILKGSEARSPDLLNCYEEVFSKKNVVGAPSLSDHFVLKEHKIPLLLESEEACEEYDKSLAVFEDYSKNHNEIPKLPIPLCVLEYSDDIWKNQSGFLKVLKDDHGIAIEDTPCSIFAYIYKGYPNRLKHWKMYGEAKNVSREEWSKTQEEFFDIKDTLNSYFQNFIRLSDLGWILAPVGQEHIGYALKSQNLTLDGGFVDLGNAYKIDKISKNAKIDFINSIYYLSESITHLMVPSGRMTKEFENTLVSNFVIRTLSKNWGERQSPLAKVFGEYFESEVDSFQESLNSLIGNYIKEDFEIIL